MNLPVSTATSRVRIFFIEDDPAVMNLFSLFITRLPQFAYLGCAQTLGSAVLALESNKPELVFVDVNMPDGDGLDHIPRLRQAAPGARLALCTSKDDPAFVQRAIGLERVDLVHKHDVSTAERFLRVFETMKTQQRFVSPRLARVAEELRNSESFTKKLSDRELMLLPFFGRNLADSEIGRLVGIVPGTVRLHRQNVMGKLDLHTSAGLVAWCVENGFVERRDFLDLAR